MPYRYRKRWTRRERTVIAVPLVVSLVLWLLPSSWTGRLINAVQFLNPFQIAADGSVHAVESVFGGDVTTISAEEARQIELANAALRHRIIALSARVDELDREVHLLGATRAFTVDGRRLGPVGRLIPATVLGDDFLPWRSSLLLAAGTSDGVRIGQPVASRHFTIGLAPEEEAVFGQAILLGEVLIGWVEQSGTHASRVRLCSDLATQMKVRIGRWTGDGVVLVDGYYWLTGRGRGAMQVGGVERRLLEGEPSTVAVGDVVVSDPMSQVLPAALCVGTIESIAPDVHNPLLAVVMVRAPLEGSSLDRVYVFDPTAR
jgi:cell shape-determining protein MreC